MEANLQATVIFIAGFIFGFLFRHIRGYPITRQITGLKGTLPKMPPKKAAFTIGKKRKPIVKTEEDGIDYYAARGGFTEL